VEARGGLSKTIQVSIKPILKKNGLFCFFSLKIHDNRDRLGLQNNSEVKVAKTE